MHSRSASFQTQLARDNKKLEGDGKLQSGYPVRIHNAGDSHAKNQTNPDSKETTKAQVRNR